MTEGGHFLMTINPLLTDIGNLSEFHERNVDNIADTPSSHTADEFLVALKHIRRLGLEIPFIKGAVEVRAATYSVDDNDTFGIVAVDPLLMDYSNIRRHTTGDRKHTFEPHNNPRNQTVRIEGATFRTLSSGFLVKNCTGNTTGVFAGLYWDDDLMTECADLFGINEMHKEDHYLPRADLRPGLISVVREYGGLIANFMDKGEVYTEAQARAIHLTKAWFDFVRDNDRPPDPQELECMKVKLRLV